MGHPGGGVVGKSNDVTRDVAFYEADATNLPVPDGTFDAALSVQVLEYVPDATAALAEMHRALRPGGRVVIWDVDWATVTWHSEDPERMARVLRAWDEHLTNMVSGPSRKAAIPFQRHA